MHQGNLLPFDVEYGYRLKRITRRAELRAALGPVPTIESLPAFERRDARTDRADSRTSGDVDRSRAA